MHYLKWTKEAAYCFECNMICKGCTNEYICIRYKEYQKKEWRIKNKNEKLYNN